MHSENGILSDCEKPPKAAIIGYGQIGQGFAKLFDAVGFSVKISDPVKSDSLSLVDAISGADFIVEAIPEVLSAKQAAYAQAQKAMSANAIYVSTSSAIPISKIAADLSHERAMIAHPLNPSDIIPLVEIVPGPGTSPDAVERIVDLFNLFGRHPLVLMKEVTGFAANRLQMALFRELTHLIGQGVVRAADADHLLTKGLALRWALNGPLRTFHLNSDKAFADYFEGISDHLSELTSALCASPQLHAEGLAKAYACEDTQVLPNQLKATRTERNARLSALIEHLQEMAHDD